MHNPQGHEGLFLAPHSQKLQNIEMHGSIPRKIWLLAACNAVVAAGYALSMPFLAVYLSVKRGVPMSVTGGFLAVSMAFTALGSAWGGEMADAFGRRKIMLFSLFTRSLVIAAMAGAMWLDLHFIWLVGLHILNGLSGALFGPASQSWVADQTPSEKRVEAFGVLRIGSNLGWALGPMLGGLLALKSYAAMFAVSAVVYFFTACALIRVIEETRPSAVERQASLVEMLRELRNARFARFCACLFLISAVMSQLVVGLSLYCVKYIGLLERQVGVLFSINGLMVVFLQYVMTRSLSRIRISSGIALGCCFYALGYGYIGFASSYAAIIAGVVVLTLGELAVSPGVHAIAANMAGPDRKGRYMGMAGVVQQSGSALGIFLGGTGMELITPHFRYGGWMIITVIALAAAIGFHGLAKILTDKEDGVRTNEPADEEQASALP